MNGTGVPKTSIRKDNDSQRGNVDIWIPWQITRMNDDLPSRSRLSNNRLKRKFWIRSRTTNQAHDLATFRRQEHIHN